MIEPGDSCWANKKIKLCCRLYFYWKSRTKLFRSEICLAWISTKQVSELHGSQRSRELEEAAGRAEVSHEALEPSDAEREIQPGRVWTNRKKIRQHDSLRRNVKTSLRNLEAQQLQRVNRKMPQDWRNVWGSFPEKTETFKQKPGVSGLELSVIFITILQQQD